MDFGLTVHRANSQSGNYTIDLQWKHVQSVLGYNIYRAATNSDDPADWYKINTRPLFVNYHQDRGFIGDPVNNDRVAWFYKVIPILQDGSEWLLSKSKSETFGRTLQGVQRWAAPTIRARTNMMLDPTRFSSAECVHFLVRKWAGHYCKCLDIRSRKIDANCPQCFPAGSLVRTESGWKPIESIGVGERVLTSEGSYQKVKDTFSRQYEGKLKGILSSISTQPIYSTSDHPYLVQRGSHKRHIGCGPKCDVFIKEGDGLRLDRPDVRQIPSGKWHARGQIQESRGSGRKSLGSYDTKEDALSAYTKYKTENFKPGHALIWDTASEIKKGDWLVPRWNKNIRDISEIRIPERFLKKEHPTGPKRNGETTLPVDEEFLWVIGLYLAEGSAGSRSLSFALHEEETEYAQRVITFFEKYGYTTYIRKAKNTKGIVVYVYSTSLAQWFPEWVGSRCYEKHIPNEFINLPNNKVWAIIEGIYAGDNGDVNEIVQTSEHLALQLVELLHRVGEQPLVRRHVSNVLTPKGNKRRVAYAVNWAFENALHDNRKNRWVFKGDILTKVTSISEKDFSGLVYNLEVEGDHTYIVNGVVVHNCFGTGYEGGFALIENVLCRVRSVAKTINSDSGGLTVKEITTGTIVAYPILTEGDILIREHNLRFRVRDPKARATQGYVTAQAFNLEQMQLFDMAYRVPAPAIVQPTQRLNRGAGVSNVLS